VLVTLQVWILLLNCIVVGAGLSYFTDVDFSLEERVSFGAFFGLLWFVILTVLLSQVLDFTAATVTLAAGIAFVTAAVAVGLNSATAAADLASFSERVRLPVRSPDSPAILAALLVPSWIAATRILMLAYNDNGGGGLGSGHLATFSDWQAHLTYTASFTYANNVGFDLPMATGVPMQYHNGINVFAATLATAGAELHDALTISAGYCAFAFPAVMYLVGRRIFESRAIALLGTLLFFLFGGWGWRQFFSDVGDQGLGIINNLPFTYTRLQIEDDIWMENPVIGHLFPQRPTLIGFPITLIVCALLWRAVQTRSNATFATAGVIVGVMPFFNLFGFGTPLALGLIWAGMEILGSRGSSSTIADTVDDLSEDGDELVDTAANDSAAKSEVGDLDPESAPVWIGWLYFAVPALMLALVVVLLMLPENSDSADWWFGWATETMQVPAGSVGAIIWFWIKNFGFFLPLLLIAQLWKGVVPRRIALASIPIWLWFIVPNFIKPHPWPGNNTHYFVFVLLLGAFLVAALLMKLIESWKIAGGVVVGFLMLTMTLAGVLDIWSASDSSTGRAGLMEAGDVAAGMWARNNTEPDSVFVIPVIVGFAGWVFDLGVSDWNDRATHSTQILQGAEGHQAYLDQYGVDYVVIGPFEMNDAQANPDYWDGVAPLVYDFGGYRIYEVT